jgi:hypothetical protein
MDLAEFAMQVSFHVRSPTQTGRRSEFAVIPIRKTLSGIQSVWSVEGRMNDSLESSDDNIGYNARQQFPGDGGEK